MARNVYKFVPNLGHGLGLVHKALRTYTAISQCYLQTDLKEFKYRPPFWTFSCVIRTSPAHGLYSPAMMGW